MIRILIAALIGIGVVTSFFASETTSSFAADNAAARAFQESLRADYRTAQLFQEALRADNKQAVAKLIRYPLWMEYPLPAIKSAADFIKNWDDFFDAANIKSLLASKPTQVGWRGVALGPGDVWFDEGRIITLNLRTREFDHKLHEAINRDNLKVHPSARGYKNIAVTCSTPTKDIRIQEHADGFHYFAWKKDSDHLAKPELTLRGTAKFEGSAGLATFTFERNGYKYLLSQPDICETRICTYELIVERGGKKLSTQVCK